jgi:hypothetical protein
MDDLRSGRSRDTTSSKGEVRLSDILGESDLSIGLPEYYETV